MDSAAGSLPDEKKQTAPPQLVQRNIFRYAFPLVSVALALGVALLARRYGLQHQFFMLMFAVAVTGWYCGMAPAMVAVVCSSMAYEYFFREPHYSFVVHREDIPDGWSLFGILSADRFCATESRISCGRARRST